MRQAKPELVALLTPEQLTVYQHWLEQDDLFKKQFAEWLEAIDTNDDRRRLALQEEIKKMPLVCDHNVPCWDTCGYCMEIEHLLYPELYDENGDLKDQIPATEETSNE